jgi:hypothetical protein
MFFGRGKVRSARKVDNYTAICEPTDYNIYGSLEVLEPCGPPRSITGIALPLQILYTYILSI